MSDETPDLPPSPPTPEPPPSDPAGGTATNQPTDDTPLEKFKQVANRALDYCREVGQFYWTRREPLKDHIWEYFPGLMQTHNRRREIRLQPYEERKNAEFSEDGWKIELPGSCIVCSNSNDCQETREKFSVETLTWTIRAIVIGLVAGIPLMLFFWSIWVYPIPVLLAIPIGYYLRGEIKGRIIYSRCANHRDDDQYPRFRQFGDELIILTGHKNIPQRFRRGTDTSSGSLLGTYIESPSEPAPPVKIQLAESSDTEIVPEAPKPLGDKDQDDDALPDTFKISDDQPPMI